MSLNTSKRTLKIIKFSKFYDNSIPLLKVKINCPKQGEDRLVFGIIDSGSKYTIVNSSPFVLLPDFVSSYLGFSTLEGVKFVDEAIISATLASIIGVLLQ